MLISCLYYLDVAISWLYKYVKGSKNFDLHVQLVEQICYQVIGILRATVYIHFYFQLLRKPQLWDQN